VRYASNSQNRSVGTWAPQRPCTWHSWFPNRTAKTCVHTWSKMYV